MITLTFPNLTTFVVVMVIIYFVNVGIFFLAREIVRFFGPKIDRRRRKKNEYNEWFERQRKARQFYEDEAMREAEELKK